MADEVKTDVQVEQTQEQPDFSIPQGNPPEENAQTETDTKQS